MESPILRTNVSSYFGEDLSDIVEAKSFAAKSNEEGTALIQKLRLQNSSVASLHVDDNTLRA